MSWRNTEEEVWLQTHLTEATDYSKWSASL